MAPITSDLAALADERIREAQGRAARRRLARGQARRSPQSPRTVVAGAQARVPGGLAQLIGRVPALQAWR
jgi:hypothetical protein